MGHNASKKQFQRATDDEIIMHRKDPRLTEKCEMWRAVFNFKGHLHPKQCRELIKAIEEKSKGKVRKQEKYGLELAKEWKEEADKRKKEICSFYFGKKASDLEGESSAGASVPEPKSESENEDESEAGAHDDEAFQSAPSSPRRSPTRVSLRPSRSHTVPPRVRSIKKITSSARARDRTRSTSRSHRAAASATDTEMEQSTVKIETMSVSAGSNAPPSHPPPQYKNIYPNFTVPHLQNTAATAPPIPAAMSPCGLQSPADPPMTMPMIELPNGAGAVVHVYRPWTEDDMLNAIKTIPNPKEDIIECVKQLQDLRRSFKLTPTECERVLRRVCGAGWVNVEGDWSPWVDKSAAILVELAWDHGDLKARWDALIQRMQAFYKLNPDYTKLSTITQKPNETVDEVYARVVDAFEKFSGLPKPDVLDGKTPWEQQLKAQVDRALKEELQWSIHKHLITWRTCSLTEFMEYARHAERVASEKKKRVPRKHAAAAGSYVVDDCDYTRDDIPDFDSGSAPQPRPKRRITDYQGRRDRRECFICGKKGHKARHCDQNPENIARNKADQSA